MAQHNLLDETQLETLFNTRVQADETPPTILEAMAIPEFNSISVKDATGKTVTKKTRNYKMTDVERTPHGMSYEFKLFTRPQKQGTESDVPTEKASAGNIFKAGNKITTSQYGLGHEKFKINSLYKDGYEISKEDLRFTTIPDLVNQIFKTYKEGQQLFREAQISRVLLTGDRWITGATDVAVNGAITAGATTFDVDDVTDIAAGRLLKIGNTISTVTTEQEAENYDVVLVKSVSVNTITIETDPALFPTNLFGFSSFKGLSTSLKAHADATKVQIDKPKTLSEALSAGLINDLQISTSEQNLKEDDTLFLMNHAPFGKIRGTSSPVVANEFFGRQVLKSGKIDQLYGAKIFRSNFGICRNDGTSNVYYIIGFERNRSFVAPKLLESSAVEPAPQQAGLVKTMTWAEINGAHAHRAGRRRIVVMPVVLG